MTISSANAAASRRTRRHDPQRGEKILDAALEVIHTRGVGRLTHRTVAAEADVPLGSVTYHFADRQALIEAAFRRYVARQNVAYTQRFAGVSSREAFVDRLVELVLDTPRRTASGRIAFELYLAALHDAKLRRITTTWTRRSRKVLARYVGADAAADLDAFLEGLILHGLLGRNSTRPRDLRVSISRLVPAQIVRAAPDGTTYDQTPGRAPTHRVAARAPRRAHE